LLTVDKQSLPGRCVPNLRLGTRETPVRRSKSHNKILWPVGLLLLLGASLLAGDLARL
jgi:hypothetical protein